MNLEPLKKANKAIQEAKERLIRQRNEEDRKYIVASIGKDLQPFFKALVENIKGAVVEAISQIKIEPPNVKIEPTQVNVPEIKVPKAEVEVKVNNPPIKIPPIKVPTPIIPEIKIPEIKIPPIKVPTPKVTVKIPPILLKGINRDKPLNVILTDQKGKEYKAMGGIMGGGGRGGIVKIESATGIQGGTKTVATAGTAERITATNTLIRRVWIQALPTNTKAIAIGASNVDVTDASRKGLGLFASQGQWFNVDNLNRIWIDVGVNGEGINYLYEV